MADLRGAEAALDAGGEATLVAALRRGDDAAYEQLVRRYGGRLLGLARRLVGNDEDARDVLQEAFVSVFRSIDRFEGDSRLGTWLHRIVVNASFMRLRARHRRTEVSVEDLQPTYQDDGHHTEAFVSWDQPVEQMLQREELRAAVRAHIAALPEGYRDVLVLRDIQELDTRTTARLLGTTPTAVKIRLHRARTALRRLIDPLLRGETHDLSGVR